MKKHFPFVPRRSIQVGKAIAKHGREKFIVATKFGISFSPEGLSFDSSPATIRKQVPTTGGDQTIKTLPLIVTDIGGCSRA